jgi:two-component system cell cycle sensor histidine kinase/response regulator CckA
MGQDRTILLVDDDPDVRDLIEMVLDGAGHSVHAVGNAEEAMRALSGDPAIELLLTDVVMPGMSGVELARRALALRPHLRVLFITGYTRNIAPEELARAAVLDKPFVPDRLLHAIDRVLEDEAAGLS